MKSKVFVCCFLVKQTWVGSKFRSRAPENDFKIFLNNFKWTFSLNREVSALCPHPHTLPMVFPHDVRGLELLGSQRSYGEPACHSSGEQKSHHLVIPGETQGGHHPSTLPAPCGQAADASTDGGFVLFSVSLWNLVWSLPRTGSFLGRGGHGQSTRIHLHPGFSWKHVSCGAALTMPKHSGFRIQCLPETVIWYYGLRGANQTGLLHIGAET